MFVTYPVAPVLTTSKGALLPPPTIVVPHLGPPQPPPCVPARHRVQAQAVNDDRDPSHDLRGHVLRLGHPWEGTVGHGQQTLACLLPAIEKAQRLGTNHWPTWPHGDPHRDGGGAIQECCHSGVIPMCELNMKNHGKAQIQVWKDGWFWRSPAGKVIY